MNALKLFTVILLNPQSNEALFIPIIFVRSQARICGMCCGNITFGQPLYLKKIKINKGNHPQLQHLFFRVGGFHQLMSFVGARCKLMEVAGLDGLSLLSMPRTPCQR